MAIEITLSVADLAGTRFATSALGETLAAVRLLGAHASGAAHVSGAVNRPWLDWAVRELAGQPLRAGLVWPLLNRERRPTPEFLLPAPTARWPDFGDELDRLAGTPAAAVRASLRRIFGRAGWPDAAAELDTAPDTTLKRLADELRDCHDRLIAPHWDRIRPVLDADIGYRSRLLASGGARRLFGDMHPDLRWSAAGIVTIASAENFHAELGPGGLVLLPSVLGWPEVSVKRATSTQTTLSYPARGAAMVWRERDPATDAVAELLGPVRARLLDMLRTPASTTVLARQLAVTPAAVSQHLAVLHRAGLLRRERSGRAVLYEVSDLGRALLNGRVGLHADLSRRRQRPDRRAAGATAGGGGARGRRDDPDGRQGLDAGGAGRDGGSLRRV